MKKTLLTILILAFIAMIFAFYPKNDVKKLRIGASPVPHAEILEFVKEDLKKIGVELKIIEFTDYITPNIALSEGQIDANFVQHLPYLENFVRERKLDLVSLAAIHIEPIGMYSARIKNLDELKNGAIVAIPNDSTNEGRALLLLQSNNLIKLKSQAGVEYIPSDIVVNHKNLQFRELEAAMLVRVLTDVDVAIINGNYAEEAKLNPIKDALVLENTDSPYVNIIAVRANARNDPRFQKLIKLLKSEKVKKFILKKYNGSVIPV
ncbi:MAG: MetQ/NlpA family ABC transporter substrate-binding protein [Endomicrobium sp.]|jgi:D-methionine transport system substrate-binding protein|nr:MetQ/NlpA family ABC transporter substrate-binding protein [Endomicrobium sp.]